jgi:uncharacterized repeat protein (TIGR04052 family)
MKKSNYILTAMAAASVAALTACGGGGGTDNTPKSISIDFAAMSGSTPITCASSLSDLGTTNAGGTLSDLRFYVSNVKLVKADGSTAALALDTTDNFNATKGGDTVTLIDLEDKTGTCVGTTATNSTIKGTVPAGDYVGVKMTLGVPLAMNHTDHTADLSVTPAVINNAVHPGMAWSWAGGRKFTKIEVTNSTWTAPTFNVHLGSTGCTGTNPAAGQVDTCSRPNRVDFGFASFNPGTQKVAVDVKALLTGNNVTLNGPVTPINGIVAGPTGCMSGATDYECAEIFSALSLDLTAGTTLNGGLNQRLFKVVSK